MVNSGTTIRTREKYQDRKSKGLCTVCGIDIMFNGLLCEEHYKRKQGYEKKRIKRNSLYKVQK